MMFKVKKLTWVLGCTLALSGCASYYKNDSLADIDIKPVMIVNHANGSPKIMYLLGRYYQGKIDYKKAIAAYEKALAANPDYVAVHNGLGVIYSIQGRHELALQHFQKAISLEPMATYLHNNIGYAYLTQGRETDAAASLRQALQIDPKNKQARTNLAVTFERVGLHDEAALLMLAAPGSKTIEPSAEIATTALRNTMPVHVADVTVAESPAQNQTGTKLMQVAPNIYEYISAQHDPLLAILTDQGSVAQEDTSINNKMVRIEVSNGNGVTGMAREVSDFFQKNGFVKARLTNHQTFRQPHTAIYYQSGNHEQAKLINQMLPSQVRVIENSELRGDIQVKILLGQDFSRKTAYFNKNGNVEVVARK